jgi:putative ABC transport system permease protein
MVLFRFTLREVWLRPLRAGLTLLSIVIGVGAIVAVTIANQTTHSAHQAMFETVTGKAALEVAGEDGGRVDQSLVEKLDGTPGLTAAVPVLEGKASVYPDRPGADGIDVQAIGIDLQRHDAVNDYEIVEGQPFSDDRGVLLTAHLASQLGVAVGDQVTPLAGSGLRRRTEPVVGFFKPQRATAVSNLSVVLLPLQQAQQRLGAEGEVTRILLVLRDDAHEDAVRAAVAQRLTPGLTVRRPPTRNQISDETGLAIRQGTNLALAFALLVAVFVILNTFLMSVGERTKQLAILRAVGASRWQIAWLIAREALLMGLAGAAGGALVGVLFARLLIQGMERLFKTSLPETHLTWVPFAVAAGVGLGVSLLGAIFPVLKTLRITPREGIQGGSRDPSGLRHRWTTAIALMLLIAALGVIWLCQTGRLPMIVAVFATVAILISVVFGLPLVLRPATRLIASLAPGFLRVETTLAQRQLLRNPGRSTLTIGVLFIAVSTGVGLANTILDNVYTVKNWYRKTVVGDFFIWVGEAPGADTSTATNLPEAMTTEIEQMPDITGIDKLSFVPITVQGQSPTVIVRDFPSEDYVNFDTPDADSATLKHRLEAGEVVVGSVLAERAGWKTGDEIVLNTSKSGDQPIRIAAVANDYRYAGVVMYMHRGTAERLLNVPGVQEFILRARPDRRAEVDATLRELCQKYASVGPSLHSVADISQMIDGMMNGVVGGLWGLLVLGFVVASLGLANTLTMNVLEQTRELGMLRVVAMTRQQVRKMIFSQAVVMGAIALLPGVLAGVGVAFLINRGTLPVTGHPIPFAVHPAMLGLAFAAAYLIVVAVAWLPAERAARLSPSTCLQYE